MPSRRGWESVLFMPGRAVKPEICWRVGVLDKGVF